MTIPTQPSQTDPRRPSVSTSSLPLVGSPFGHRLPNLTQHAPSYRTSSPPYHSSYPNPSTYGGPAGLVTANQSPLPLLKNPYHEQHEATETSPPSPSGSYRPLNVIDALAYLDQVKGRFSDKPNVYNQFLDIMKDFKSQSIDTPGVIERVSSLFKGHPLLISGFNTFLPAGYRIECSIDPRDPNRIIVTTPNGNTTTSTTTTAEEMLKINIPSSSSSSSSSHYYHQQGFNPPSYYSTSSIIPQASPPPPASKPPVEFNHAINYVNRIKNRFAHNPDIYKQFLEILQIYQKEQKPISEVYSHVQYLFNGADDLLQEFKQFLPEMTLSKPIKRKKPLKKLKKQDDLSFDPIKPMVSIQETELFERIKKHIGTKPSYEEFLKTLNLYTQQIVDIDLLIVHLHAFLGSNKDLFDAFKLAIGYQPTEIPIEKPISFAPKPDLLSCKKVASSASYRQVPKDWQNQPCSGRDQMCWEVLNDEYASHPIWNSEDSGFVASKKNQYEEALHRCEEERYEYDLNIEANLNTIALIEPIALSIEKMTLEQQNQFRLEPGLGGQTISIYERMIKKVYDNERGTEIIEMLYQKPATVIPVLLKRLKLKDKEWKKAQRDWNKIWRELDAKNFYRSLDYQGNLFKTNDKKAFINRTLITEIEVLMQKDTTLPQLVYEFKDQFIFGDISRLIFSFVDHQTGFTKSDKQKIRIFLRSFLPMFFYIEQDVDMDQDTRSITEDSDVDSPLQLVKIEDTQINHEINLFSVEKKKSIFFCHSQYYCLIRLYQVLYERLSRMKSLDNEIQSNPKLGKQFNKTALELDLYANRFEYVDLTNGYYAALLDIIDHFFEGESESQTFEEGVRYLFGIEAYTMFTIDKVVQALIKQIQTVLSDRKSIELIHLFNQSINEPKPLSSYRSSAEEILGGSDENLYKMNLDADTQQTSIQLLDKEQKESLSQQEQYQDYMTHYVNWLHPTRGIDQSLLKPSFLKRNLNQDNNSAFVRSKLRYKIQQESYHMYYIVGSEDAFYRPSSSSNQQETTYNRWHELITMNE